MWEVGPSGSGKLPVMDQAVPLVCRFPEAEQVMGADKVRCVRKTAASSKVF